MTFLGLLHYIFGCAAPLPNLEDQRRGVSVDQLAKLVSKLVIQRHGAATISRKSFFANVATGYAVERPATECGL